MSIGDHPKKTVFVVASKRSRMRISTPPDLHATFHRQFGRLLIGRVGLEFLRQFVVEDRRKLEIDDAKTAIGRSIGYVAKEGIVVSHSKDLELGKALLDPSLVHVLDPSTAIARDDFERLGIRSEQPRNKRTSPAFEVL